MDITAGIVLAVGYALIRLSKEWQKKTHGLTKSEERAVWQLIRHKQPFTRNNVWILYRFSPLHFSQTYTVSRNVLFVNIDKPARSITYAIVDNPFDKTTLRQHTITYSNKTFEVLEQLLAKQAFKHKYGSEYDIFISFGFSGSVAKESDDIRNVKLQLTYRIKREKADTPKKRKMYIREYTKCTVGEFKDLYYQTVDWNPEQSR